MGSFTGLTDFINTVSTSGNVETVLYQKMNFWVNTGTTGISLSATLTTSLWCWDGIPGSPGYPPTTAEICTRDTAGAIKQENPTSGKELYLTNFTCFGTFIGVMSLYDRLCHVSGLSGNTTNVQTINTPALTRYSGNSSSGNSIYIEVYETMSGNSFNITYTNQNGVGSRVTTVQNPRAVNQLYGRGMTIYVPLASGDTGVRSVESIQAVSASTLQGNFGITIARPIAVSGVGVGAVVNDRDWITGLPGIPKIENNACLSMLFTPFNAQPTVDNSSTLWYQYGFLSLVQR